ncbi:helix-turn-helix domain-containing protein [Elizabethkingia anophelis]|uniref:helix-turn-helix domain-containing protein n=1 Tax=Elizabethkingia anophelis TaxID=1117645 RepID=UPI003891E384
MKKIYIFFTLFSFLILSSQKNDSINISKEIWKLVYANDNKFENAQKMLTIAKTDEEKAIANRLMGDILFKKLKYHDAIEYFEKANYYATKSNFYDEMFTINYLLNQAYESIGLKGKADDHWKAVVSLSEKLKSVDYKIMVNRINSSKAEKNKQYGIALSYNLKNLKYFLNNEFKAPTIEAKNIEYGVECNRIAYLALKNNDLNMGKEYIKKIDYLFSSKSIKIDDYYFITIYYICKGIIANKEGSKEEAINWFNIAEKEASKRNEHERMKVLEERMLNGLSNASNEDNFKTYKEISEKRDEKVNEVKNQEINNNRLEIENQKYKIRVWTIFSNVLILIIILIVVFNKRRNKKLKIKVEKIIQNIKAHKISPKEDTNTTETGESLEEEEDKNEKSSTSLISKKKERELLQQFAKFENSTDYLIRNFTISNLASILDTNTKYIHFILKTHKNKNFSDYINSLKINHIITKLYEEPEYLNYKISYLADIGGFSSHSHFTQIFKKEVEISPSEFITQLKRNNSEQIIS